MQGTILIGGGTGLVGSRLSELLRESGYTVRHLSRKEDLNATFPAYKWDTKTGYIDPKAMQNVDYVINLAGAGIADKRWTEARKKLIISSRTETTLLLKKYIDKGDLQPKAYLSASAIGYYGDRGETWMHENDTPGSGFLTESVMAWENAVAEIEKTGIRTVTIRVGIVLSTEGGALPELMQTFPLRVGAYFGDGQAWYSWIHLEDIARQFIYLMENKSFKGTFNGVAPNPAQVKELVYEMKKATGKTMLIMPAPTFGLRLVFGEMADTILNSTKVASTKIEKAGFEFNYPVLAGALADLLGK